MIARLAIIAAGGIALLLCTPSTIHASVSHYVAAPLTAKLWIDDAGISAGSCSRQATPSFYSHAIACSSMKLAVDACVPGDVIVMKASVKGGYPSQTITRNLASPGCVVIAERQTKINGSLTINGDWITIDNIYTNGFGFSDIGGGHPFNVTVNNLDISGGIAFIDGGTNFTWSGGAVHDNSTANEGHVVLQGIPPTCPGAGCGTNNLTSATIQDVTFRNLTRNQQCIDSDCHNEIIRIDDGVTELKIRNNTFESNNDPNSATIFTGSKTGFNLAKNLTFENNFFGQPGTAYQGLSVSMCEGLKVSHNTFIGNIALDGCGSNGTVNATVVGNLGYHQSSCINTPGITYDHNIWLAGGVGSAGAACGVTDLPNANAGFAADGFHITSESDAITHKATSSCPLDDNDGDLRPTGLACSAGADEYVVWKIGDITHDGVINGIDVSGIVNNFNAAAHESSSPHADVNLDGVVNGIDLSNVINSFGS